jgi:hypothetical protein
MRILSKYNKLRRQFNAESHKGLQLDEHGDTAIYEGVQIKVLIKDGNATTIFIDSEDADSDEAGRAFVSFEHGMSWSSSEFYNAYMAVHQNPDEPTVATANGITVTHKIDNNGLHIKIVPAS